jgi:Acetyltransferase (GNAT) domain
MRLSIRQAGVADLPAAAQLLGAKYGRSYEPEDIAGALGRFDPEHSLAWIAFDGTKPVGMTMAFIRKLYVEGNEVRAGYWAQLYIRPEYRTYLLYPRLTQTMTKGLDKNGLYILYTGVRRTEVARAHVNLGFAKLGELRVRAKPLRPARLLFHYRAWNAGTRLAWLPDVVYGGLLKLRHPNDDGLETCDLSRAPALEEFANLLSRTPCRVRQIWNVSRLNERYASNREAEPYSLLGVRRQGKLAAAVVWRAAVRGNGVRAGVLMDVAFQDGEEYAARKVIATAERSALRENCDVMLHLDGIGEISRIIAHAGYYVSPERYSVLLWPAPLATSGRFGDLSSWRYAFGDHDTF